METDMTASSLRLGDLRKVLDNLSQRDREFALDVMHSVTRQGFATERQSAVLRKLYATATTVDTKPSLAALVSLFDTAKAAGMKQPSIRVRGEDLNLVVKLDERRPGGLVVWKANMGGFVGTITAQGAPNLRDPKAATVLRAFACDPAGQATVYGKATGQCCFCGQELTDPRSVAMGYGPICAEHFGLPWGEKKAKQPTLQVPVQAAPMTAVDRLDEAVVARATRTVRQPGVGPKPWERHLPRRTA
jgi:Family of unknown function (DUF6011)